MTPYSLDDYISDDLINEYKSIHRDQGRDISDVEARAEIKMFLITLNPTASPIRTIRLDEDLSDDES